MLGQAVRSLRSRSVSRTTVAGQLRSFGSAPKLNQHQQNNWQKGACAVAAAAVAAVGVSVATTQGDVKDHHKQNGVYDLPLGDGYPSVLPCFIEVAKGSRNKYEWDNEVRGRHGHGQRARNTWL
jgi:hypothetical protein